MTWATKEPWLTEVTAGSGLLCSHLFDGYTDLPLEPAVFFAIPAWKARLPTTPDGPVYVGEWLEEDSGLIADLYENGKVDFKDLAIFAENYQTGVSCP